MSQTDPTNAMTPPDTIYLQWYGDGDPDHARLVHLPSVTHSMDRVFPQDIEYRKVATNAPTTAEAISVFVPALGVSIPRHISEHMKSQKAEIDSLQRRLAEAEREKLEHEQIITKTLKLAEALAVDNDAVRGTLAARGRKIEAMREALTAWVEHFELLEKNADPTDRLSLLRQQFHGDRMRASRAALSLPAAEAPGESVPKQVLDAANQVRSCYCGWRDSTRRGAKMPEGADWWELEKSLNDLELVVNRHNELAEAAEAPDELRSNP